MCDAMQAQSSSERVLLDDRRRSISSERMVDGDGSSGRDSDRASGRESRRGSAEAQAA